MSLIEKYGPPKELWPQFKLDFPEARAWPQKLNVAELFVDENVRKGRGSKVAIFYEDQKITYRELMLMVNRFGNALKSLGVGVGERVMLRLPNIPEFIISSLAAQKIGAVSVPTFTLLRGREVAYIANDSEAEILVTTLPLLEEVEKVKDELKTVKHIVLVGVKPSEVKESYLSFDGLMEKFKRSTELEPVYIDQDEVVLLLYTSGTTGSPKGCIHTGRHYLAMADCYLKDGLMAREDDVWGGPPTLAFAFGHHFILSLRHGAACSLIGPRRFEPELVFSLIEKHGITVLYSVPTAFRMMVAAKEAKSKYDFSSLRVVVTAGEPCPPSLYFEIKDFLGVEVLEHIGCTELLGAFLSSRFGKVKPGSVGISVLGCDVAILDEYGRELKTGEVGYLAVKGPLGIRYWKRPEKQAEYVKYGWNYTGDLAYKDEDGFFWYISRGDGIIKTSGYRVSPHEVEDALMKHPAVAEAGVVGVPDPERGQKVVAFVVLNPSHSPSDALKEELKAFVRDQIAPYKAPREIGFIDSLPKTETGKIKRFELRRKVVG